MEQSKPREFIPQQHWWKTEEQSLGMGYYAPEFSTYNQVSPWHSGISTQAKSASQRPRSSNSGSIPGINCYPHNDTAITTIDESTGYPAPDSLVEIDHSMIMPKTHAFDIPINHRSSLDTEFDPWSDTCSHSDRNVTPEQQWSSPLPSDPMGFPQQVRRSKSRPAGTGSTPASRGVRKSTTERRTTSVPGRNRRRRAATSTSSTGSSLRTFVCSFARYGCESTFVSKNEWKRHVTSQHLQLGFYRCDVGKCSMHTQNSSSCSSIHSSLPQSRTPSPAPGQPNDFNRKDLFTQHQRRMHAPWLQSGRRRTPTDAEHAAFEASLEGVRQRCWVGLRTQPLQSQCVFCNETFTGDGSWDVRMEHIGRHFERDDRQSLGAESEDLSLREWGLNEGILVSLDGKCLLSSHVAIGV
ncbi:hypothetical protein N7488_006402 [Penicillium malachiteum]|nr:hypothetical protein N7488_006402 [Penicillium malachiteum]